MTTDAVCTFACEYDSRAKVMVVSLVGKLDPVAAEQLAPHLDEAHRTGVRRFVFDLSRLGYVGSLGLRLLVATHNRVRGEGAVALCAPAAPVLTILDMTKLNRVLRHYPTRHEALDALRV